MIHEIRLNSIHNLSGYQKADSHFARLFRMVDGFDPAMTVEAFCSYVALSSHESMFEDISPPISPEILRICG